MNKLSNIERLSQMKKILDNPEFFIDDTNKYLLSKYSWRITKKGSSNYIETDIKHKKVYLHQLIIGKVPKGKIIDHINQNTLDNRKVNLRVANKSINGYNSKIRYDNISGFRGVSFDKARKLWIARIMINKKYVMLGRFATKQDALRRMDKEEIKIFGKTRRHRKLVMGDCHGRIEALKEVLRLSKFNYEDDKLIVLGDIADGGYNTYEVIEELLKIKNLIFIIGNHDEWFINHIRSGWSGEMWIHQGGANTLKSYGAKVNESDYITDNSDINTDGINIPITHQIFLNNGVFYHEQDGMLFVHGGFDPRFPINAQEKEYLLWDRSIIGRFKSGLETNYKKIFIGHTTVQHIMNDINWTKPVCIQSTTTDLWCLDTGAGWNGCLTIMDIDTEEYWQSKIQKPAIGDKHGTKEKEYDG